MTAQILVAFAAGSLPAGDEDFQIHELISIDNNLTSVVIISSELLADSPNDDRIRCVIAVKTHAPLLPNW
jgi:hypothetical protein